MKKLMYEADDGMDSALALHLGRWRLHLDDRKDVSRQDGRLFGLLRYDVMHHESEIPLIT